MEVQRPGMTKPLHSGGDTLRFLLAHVVAKLRTGRSIARSTPSSSAPAPTSPTCGFLSCTLCTVSSSSSRFSLSNVFKGCVPPPPPALPLFPHHSSLLSLPDDILLRIVLNLTANSFSALSDTHFYLKAFMNRIVPGLKLALFPHQIHALQRMERMESGGFCRFPLVEVLAKVRGGVIVVDLVNGALLKVKEVPRVPLPVGGLLCDEPGMGKTITALSHILRTKGTLPTAPKGCTTRVLGNGLTVYRDEVKRRYQSYCSAPLAVSRRDRLLGIRRSNKRKRNVVRPDFLSKNTGKGSLPNISDKGGDVVLSCATLIAVPQVLVGHWLNQIKRHLKEGALKVHSIVDEKNYATLAISAL